MQNKTTILLAGGDLRQARLANRFASEQNTDVYALGLNQTFLNPDILSLSVGEKDAEKIAHADYLILPMPAMEDAIYINAPFSETGRKWKAEDILKLLPKTATVFAGKVTTELQALLTRYELRWYDYLEREELAVFNAEATSEGTLQILMEELPVTIKGLSVLITGSGRIAKILRRQLLALGAKVAVTARKKSDLAWIEIDGCDPIPITELPKVIGDYEVIINTVPAKILEEALLKKLDSETLVVDLASKPGGVDFNTASSLGIKTIWALSLPGKVAPITSGDIIYQTICNIINENREAGENSYG